MATANVGSEFGSNHQGSPNESLSPRLETAPDLPSHLGLCIAVSSPLQCSSVHLLYFDAFKNFHLMIFYSGPGLGTNLIHIANERNNGFLRVYNGLEGFHTHLGVFAKVGASVNAGFETLKGQTKSLQSLTNWQDCGSRCCEVV